MMTEMHDTRFSLLRTCEVEDDQSVIPQHAPKTGTKVSGKPSVAVEPPECGPSEGNEPSATLVQSRKLVDGCYVVHRPAAVFSVQFREWDRSAGWWQFAAHLLFVNENHRLTRTGEPSDVGNDISDA